MPRHGQRTELVIDAAALGTTAPDLPPVPGRHAAVDRDHEYVRHGTVTLMAGTDLVTGHVHRAVVEQHRSREFAPFLRGLDDPYTRPTRPRPPARSCA